MKEVDGVAYEVDCQMIVEGAVQIGSSTHHTTSSTEI